MSTVTATTEAEILADAETVIAALSAGTMLAPVIAQRIQERSERIRERVLQHYGPLDIAIPSIRELRDA